MPVLFLLLLVFVLPSSLPAADLSAALLKEFSEPATDSIKLKSFSPVSLERSLELPFSGDSQQSEAGPDFDISLLKEQLPGSDIPLTLNSKVNYFTDYFQHQGRSSFIMGI
jgi:membrane-bound lytic murein transglycosylase D